MASNFSAWNLIVVFDSVSGIDDQFVNHVGYAESHLAQGSDLRRKRRAREWDEMVVLEKHVDTASNCSFRVRDSVAQAIGVAFGETPPCPVEEDRNWDPV